MLKVRACFSSSKYEKTAGLWWLTPVIQVTWEVEIRRIIVPGQSKQIVPEILSQKYPTKKGGLVEWFK
jgi:hypothetical protein